MCVKYTLNAPHALFETVELKFTANKKVGNTAIAYCGGFRISHVQVQCLNIKNSKATSFFL